MDRQSGRDQLRHAGVDKRHHLTGGMKSSFPSSSLAVPKREVVDGFQTSLFRVKLESPREVLKGTAWIDPAFADADVKVKTHQRLSPEAEAGAWIRDEPVDVAAVGGLLCTASGAAVGRDCGGDGDVEEGRKTGESQLSSGTVVSQSTSQEHQLTVVVDDAAQPVRSSTTAGLFAQLRATKIRESVIRAAIQRLGGGQKGLRAVIKVILFWLRERNRSLRSSEGHPDIAEEVDQLRWLNAGPGTVVDAQFPSFGNPGRLQETLDRDLQVDTSHFLSSAFSDGGGSLCDLKIGYNSSGEYGDVQDYEKQSPAIGGDSGKLGGILNGMCVQEVGVPLAVDTSLLPSGCWVPSVPTSEGRHHGSIRKLSPSPDGSGLLDSPDITAYEDAPSHRNKIRRLSQSPAGNSSSQGSNESLSSAYGSSDTSPTVDVLGAPGIFGSVGGNPFAPGGAFNLPPSSPPPMDVHSMDTGPFTYFGLQGSILMDENLSLGVPTHGCGVSDRLSSLGPMYPVSAESCVDREHSGVSRLEILAKAKASPGASTRLARKNRMDRNRKVASHHAIRAATSAQTGVVSGGSSGMMWPFLPSNLCNMVPSQAFTASERQGSTTDRRDHENLQFLLQKVLRPSDVGNLGRIVLPKKDAESHLPWLGAREGVQFACEDYDTGEKLMLRYRFWPNNKSRMYLLENTGDFVKKHQLQESDRLLIYRNQQGTYIMRGRKARDCADLLSSQVQAEETEGEGKDLSRQSSFVGVRSRGASSSDKDIVTSETHVGSGQEVQPDSAVIVTAPPQDDLLNFADLPDAPMGEGAENLVRFPSLEAFDVEMLELVPAEKHSARAGRFNSG